MATTALLNWIWRFIWLPSGYIQLLRLLQTMVRGEANRLHHAARPQRLFKLDIVGLLKISIRVHTHDDTAMILASNLRHFCFVCYLQGPT